MHQAVSEAARDTRTLQLQKQLRLRQCEVVMFAFDLFDAFKQMPCSFFFFYDDDDDNTKGIGRAKGIN